jgi:hypothetical protein
VTSTSTAPPQQGWAPPPQGQQLQQRTGQVVRPPSTGGLGLQNRGTEVTSAQRVMRMSVVSVVVMLLVAALGFLLALNQASGLDRASTRADRVLTVMDVRGALLDADGAATNAFLVGGLEPQARRTVYDAAIAAAATGLAQLAEGADAEDASLIADLNADLATYTGLIEAARVNNRQGFPVGAAYLDQGSTLVREEMLATLDTVLTIAADDAAADFGAGNLSIVIVVAVLAAFVLLVVCQVRLARMTRRRLNPGLAIATVLLLVAFGAGALGATSSATAAGQVRVDSYRPTLAVAQASVLAAEARTLESLTLIKRGSGEAFEVEFVGRTDEAIELLGDTQGRLASSLQDWVDLHADIRGVADSGDWDRAVEMAITDAEGGASQAYAQFVESAAAVVDSGSSDVESGLSDAAGQARLAAWVLLVTGILGAVACWRGMAPRREEYR